MKTTKVIDLTGRGVCARRADVEVESGVVTGLTVMGGCSGWARAFASLAIGRPVVEVADAMRGVKCSGRDTCCAAEIFKEEM